MMENQNINIGDVIEVDGIEGRHAVVQAHPDDPLITCRELTAQPGRGKPFKVSKFKVKILARSIPVSNASLFEPKGI